MRISTSITKQVLMFYIFFTFIFGSEWRVKHSVILLLKKIFKIFGCIIFLRMPFSEMTSWNIWIFDHISSYFTCMDINFVQILNRFVRFTFLLLFFNMNNICMLFEICPLDILVTVLSFFPLRQLLLLFHMNILYVQLESAWLLELLVTVRSFYLLLFMNKNTLIVRCERTLEILFAVLSFFRLWHLLI